MAANCPDQVGNIDEECADRTWFEDKIYSVLDDIVDATNIHIQAEGNPAQAKIVRPWNLNPQVLAASSTEMTRVKTFVTDLLATGRVPKYMYEEGNVPNRYPNPQNAADVQDWINCDGYWANLAAVVACMALDPNTLLWDADCLTYGPANSLYKVLKCLSEGSCHPNCQCPECSDAAECRCYAEITYDPVTEVWSPASLDDLDWECRVKEGDFLNDAIDAWIADGQDESGVCYWHIWSTVCEEI